MPETIDMWFRGLEEQEKENGSHIPTTDSWELKAEKTRRGDRGPPGPAPVSRTSRGKPGGPEKQAEALRKDAKIQECEKGLPFIRAHGKNISLCVGLTHLHRKTPGRNRPEFKNKRACLGEMGAEQVESS